MLIYSTKALIYERFSAIYCFHYWISIWMGRKRIKTQQSQMNAIYPGLKEAVDNFVNSRNMYYAKINLASLYAEVLSTEFHVCPKSQIGFKKYLN